ncbi:MAG: hypothetical protein ABI743_03495 [bacterium]
MPRALLAWLAAALLIVPLACKRDATATHPTTLRFVRDGIVIPETKANFAGIGHTWTMMEIHHGITFGADLFLPWQGAPGDRIFTKQLGTTRVGRIPENPSPWTMATMPLEDVRAVTLTGNLADSCVAVAGTTVATGTYNGQLHVARIGEQPRTISLATGGMVKCLGFNIEAKERPNPPDGTVQPDTLFVGEQTPRGRFRCLDVANLTERWGFDVATDLGEGMLPKPDDLYGIYALPGIFQVVIRRDAVFFVGVHSFTDNTGTKINRSRLYAYKVDGTPMWAWPAAGPAPLNILRFALANGTLVLATSRSEEAAPDPVYQDRAVYVLDRTTGLERAHLQIPPLTNDTEAPFIWQSVGITGDGTIGAIGLSDGRGLLLELPQASDPTPQVRIRDTLDLGTPIETAGVTLTAPVAYCLCTDTMCYFHTAGSNIPAGSSGSATTPPAPHPGANTLVAVDPYTGNTQWSYRDPTGFNGLFSDAGGRWLLTTTGNPLYPDQEGGYGILLFDTQRTGEGAARIVWKQPLDGAPFFNAAVSNDGFLIAVTETPVRNADGVSFRGTFQTHVLH